MSHLPKLLVDVPEDLDGTILDEIGGLDQRRGKVVAEGVSSFVVLKVVAQKLVSSSPTVNQLCKY
jgi:hypothetical protein